MAYGLERGAINMEHAANNLIISNRFENNKCGVHLWWNDNAGLLKLPGVAGGEQRVIGNVVAGNQFEINSQAPFPGLGQDEELIVLQLRDPSLGKNVFRNAWFANGMKLSHPRAVEFALEQGCEPVTNGVMPAYRIPELEIPGARRPVGARASLRGREQIIMDDWGPWDHASPLIRAVNTGANQRAYDLFGVTSLEPPAVLEGNIRAVVEPAGPSGVQRVILTAPAGVSRYRIALLAGDGFSRELSGTMVSTEWQAIFFPWTIDPREDLTGWRKLAEGPDATRATVAGLDFPYGWGGPKDQKLGEAVSQSSLGSDHFGMIARTRLHLPRGRWRFKVLSDDGIRVRVAGTPVIENWTWHGPTPNEGFYQQPAGSEVEIVVEHFEIDGFSTLKLTIEADE